MTDITVLVLDDHEVVRRGICDVLERADGVTVVAEAGSVQQVILSDLRLPDGTGLDVIAYVAEHLPETRIVVLTSYDDDDARAAAKAAGAHGFVPKTARSADVLQAVRDAASGKVSTTRIKVEPDSVVARLTPMEQRVLELVGQSKSNREIADDLGIAEKTVKNHVTAVLAKMGLQRRTQVVAWATAKRAGSFRG
jgi:DNA-binding NarL/FixJ family response regulator